MIVANENYISIDDLVFEDKHNFVIVNDLNRRIQKLE